MHLQEFYSDKVLLPSGDIKPALVTISDGVIVEVNTNSHKPGSGVVDLSPWVVAPGFVDTHVHGALGHNFMEGTSEAVDIIGEFLVNRGVTSVVMGTASVPPEQTRASLSTMAQQVGRHQNGLDVLGIHLEGPFLSQTNRGVHRRDAVRSPSAEEISWLITELGGALRIVTLAPEIAGGQDAVRSLNDAGIVVSLGHSSASGEEVMRAITAGARRATHFTNAIPAPDESDMQSVLLEDDRVFLELICDGHHVAPPLVKRFFEAAGAKRIIVVSDGSDVTGLPDGPQIRWEGTEVVLGGGMSRTPAGILAGSVCPLNQSLKVLVEVCEVKLADALMSLSQVPAASIGADNKGRIEVGADADVIVLDDAFEVQAVIAAGNLVKGNLDSLV